VLRYYALSAYFRQLFGCRVGKVPLDAGFSCPNRDGTLSAGGCSFCNERGSGTGRHGAGAGLRAQWDAWLARPFRRRPRLFLGYLQAYTNTHGPAARVRAVLEEAAALPGLAGLCVGTRPDCLDDEKARILAGLPVAELWLDMGLQSARDATLARVNRGHTVADFARAAELCQRHGIKVCAHLVAGLPGEGAGALSEGVAFLNALPVAGIKLHNLLVCRGAPLAADWRRGALRPLERGEYVDAVVRALAALRPDVVVHRLAADPAPGELLAPAWAAHKAETLAAVAAALDRADLWQGKALDQDAPVPLWFAPGSSPPPSLAPGAATPDAAPRA
jgi:hypothetical protein